MLLAVALPAIILAHLLGFVLLLYSLEKVSGVVSRTWKRVRGIPLDVEQRGGTHTGDGNALAASPMKAALAGVKSKGWVRGCACTVSFVFGVEGRGECVWRHAAEEVAEPLVGATPRLPAACTPLVGRPASFACLPAGGEAGNGWLRPPPDLNRAP